MNLQRQAMFTDMEIHMNQVKCNFLLLDDDKMHPGQIALMMAMKYLGPSSQRTLAKRMNCSPASVGVSVKRLEKAGLVEKQTVEQDLRATRIVLTAQGRELAERSESIVDMLAAMKYAGFSDNELEQLNDFLDRINQNLEQYQEELTKQKNRGEDNLYENRTNRLEQKRRESREERREARRTMRDASAISNNERTKEYANSNAEKCNERQAEDCNKGHNEDREENHTGEFDENYDGERAREHSARTARRDRRNIAQEEIGRGGKRTSGKKNSELRRRVHSSLNKNTPK